MNPASQAHLESLDLPDELRRRVEPFVAHLEELLEIKVRDVFFEVNGKVESHLVAFWESGMAVYEIPPQDWRNDPQTRIYAFAGRITQILLRNENRYEPDLLTLSLSFLPDYHVTIKARGPARKHLKALFRSYVLPHLFTGPLPGWERPSDDAPDDDDD